MHLSITNYTRTQHIAKADDIGEFELTFEPVGYSDTLVKVEGNKAVIGYITYDTDCPNPIEDSDCMGKFITDDSRHEEPYSHLGLTESPYRGEISRDFECDGVYEAAVNLLKTRLIHDSDFLDYCEEEFERVTEEDKADMAFMEACIDLIDWGKYGTPIPLWLEAIWEVAQDEAWDQLYEQGKIGTYLAVPCRWHDSVHGPGTAEAYTCDIGDCNAVWIPTKDDLDNIVSPGDTYEQSYAKAVKYAEGILEEYVKWARGETYGIVVETYTKEGDEWVQTEEDACWGFIGGEYAEQEMKSVFDYHCKEIFGGQQ